jgi:hypothetical protein
MKQSARPQRQVSETTFDELHHVFGTGAERLATKLRDWFPEEMPEENEEEDDSDGEPTPTPHNGEPDKKAVARKKEATRKYLKDTLDELNRHERKLHKKGKNWA